MPLRQHLGNIITSEGPISVARYMTEALLHPAHGYYTNRDPFGAEGDFITAPESSQIFGELIGLWLLQCWQQMGRPAPFHLVELGPGRGLLMADVLRAAKLMPEFPAAAEIHLIEASEKLRQAQRQQLDGQSPHWHHRLEDVPDGPMLLVANEFFDALPIRQVQFQDGDWFERLIDWTGSELHFVLAPEPAAVETPDTKPANGAIWEFSTDRSAVMAEIADRLSSHPGYALVIDYGFDHSGFGDTLQAVRRHRFEDPLNCPGEADLTSHVDFAALAGQTIQAKTPTWGPIGQGAFLSRLGIAVRAATLKADADERQKRTIDRALERLTGVDQMGRLFKVMAAGHQALDTPAGFEGER